MPLGTGRRGPWSVPAAIATDPDDAALAVTSFGAGRSGRSWTTGAIYGIITAVLKFLFMTSETDFRFGDQPGRDWDEAITLLS